MSETYLNKHSIDTSISELLSLIAFSKVFINHTICLIIILAGVEVLFGSYSKCIQISIIYKININVHLLNLLKFPKDLTDDNLIYKL